MADKRCENGHFIDESWDLCPYCPPDAPQPDEPVVKPRPRTNADRPRATRDEYGPPKPEKAPEEDRKVGMATVARLEPEPEAAGRYVVGWLIGLNGSVRGESFPVRIGRNTLGRSRNSDIWVQDDQASAHHADLVYRPEEKRYILMDHNSTNGTFVNGVEIEPRRDLSSRDVIAIGSHRMIFVPLSDVGLSWDDQGELR